MMYLVSKNSGLTMWEGEATTKMEAVQALHEDVGIDPNGDGLEVIAGQFIFTDDLDSTN